MSKLLKRLNDNQNKVADTNGIMKLQAWDYGVTMGTFDIVPSDYFNNAIIRVGLNWGSTTTDSSKWISGQIVYYI